MTSRTLSLRTLIDAKACADQVDLFRECFGKQVEVTETLCTTVFHLFAWAARHLLSTSAWDDYQRVRVATLGDYWRVIEAASADYGHVAAALVEYKRVTAAAFARAYIAGA